MNFKGRRLKRYLFLKRKNVEFLGGVEILMPDKLLGWVASKDGNLDEIRLYLGEHLIAKSPINIKRTDVNKTLKLDQDLGFIIKFPEIIPKDLRDLEPKLIAISYSGNKTFELSSINSSLNLKIGIKNLFASNLLGAKGHFDGLVNKKLTGWAGQPNNVDDLFIWMQCKGLTPIKIICDTFRNDLDKEGINSESGFAIDINRLSKHYIGKEIYFSFDENGLIRLPQINSVILEKKDFENQSLKEFKDNNNLSLIDKDEKYLEMPEDLQGHWDALEKFNLELKEIEYRLNEK